MLGDPADVRVAQLVLTPKEDGYDFKISSVAKSGEEDSGWRVHVTGHILALEEENEGADLQSIAAEISRLDPSVEQLSGGDFYTLQAKSGYELGPTFRWLERVWLGGEDALATLRMPDELANSTWHGFIPASLIRVFKWRAEWQMLRQRRRPKASWFQLRFQVSGCLGTVWRKHCREIYIAKLPGSVPASRICL